MLNSTFCDEVGYVPLAEVGAEFLFQVIAERAERTAVIVTTNLPFSEWTQVIRTRDSAKRCWIESRTVRTSWRPERNRIASGGRWPKGRKENARQRRSELWKCRPVESLESQEQASHPYRSPWKARKHGGLPTFPQLRQRILT